jgi:hypothetical protein
MSSNTAKVKEKHRLSQTNKKGNLLLATCAARNDKRNSSGTKKMICVKYLDQYEEKS